MFPSFILFGREIGLYPFVAIVAALIAGFFAMRAAKSRGLGDQQMLTTLLFAALGVFVGGALLYAVATGAPQVLQLWRQGWFAGQGFRGVFYFFYLLFGGSVYYGGLLGGLLAGMLYLWRCKAPIPQYADIAAPTIALFHGFGRIGCFLGGCCYGIPFSPGVTFRHAPVASANGVERLPVQLLEAGFEFALFLVFWLLLRKGMLQGKLLPLYLAVYAVGRFFLEFLRGDGYRGFWLGLSTSQIVALLVLVGCGIWAARQRAKPKSG